MDRKPHQICVISRLNAPWRGFQHEVGILSHMGIPRVYGVWIISTIIIVIFQGFEPEPAPKGKLGQVALTRKPEETTNLRVRKQACSG